MSTSADTEFSAKEVALHRETSDAWMIIHGEVFDVTKYLHDHPGGADVLVEAAGMDASEAFDNAGHSDDAFEIMEQYRVGKLKGAKKFGAAPIKITLQPPVEKKPAENKGLATISKSVAATAIAAGAIGGLCYAASLTNREIIPQSMLQHLKAFAPSVSGIGIGGSSSSSSPRHGLGFFEGILAASAVFAVAGTLASHEFSKMVDFHANIFANPTHMRMPKSPRPDPLLERGWLHPSTYQTLPLVRKELVALNVYRFVFELPSPQAVAGLPIGQHVAIAGTVDGKTVTRSYTPVSNNADRGVLELVVRCYPDGQLTGGYLSRLRVGDEVAFRGPKGAMRYRRGLCRAVGMLAGGTGITPMYQLIRAICEDERDTTEVSLVYANRSEGDVLLRPELERLARRYPQNFRRLYYLFDVAPETTETTTTNWAYGVGRVSKEVMAEHFPGPAPDTKIMICGPPGMVKGATSALVELGFDKAAATSKMSDQVFVF